MSVSPSQIKELREKTGAGMMDCKKALSESDGDMDAAIDWLRTKGLAQASKKSDRVAAEGLVAVKQAENRKQAAAIELNSETDFVARNEQFQTLADAFAGYALQTGGDVEQLKEHTCSQSGKPVKEVITEAIATIGENILLRRAAMLQVENGVVATYTHSAVKPDMGKIGVLVALESEGDPDALEQFGRQLAMHIAAARPEALTRDEVKAEQLERERAIFKEQAIASGKTPEIAEKMVEGRMRKYYEEIVLPEQIYVIDGKARVSEAVEAFAKEIGQPVTIAGFVRFALGEGVETDNGDGDFASEVAKMAGVA